MSSIFDQIRTHGLRLAGQIKCEHHLDFEKPVSLYDCEVRNVKIGSYSYAAKGTAITSAEIGRYCSIGEGCRIGLTQHPKSYLTTSPVLYHRDLWSWYSENKTAASYDDQPAPIKVGHDVWIGAAAMIMGGLTIGNGSIVAAGSVVTRDVAPYSIVAGVPAKQIGFRLPSEIAEQLSEIEWWNYDISKMPDTEDSFDVARVDQKFIDNLRVYIKRGLIPPLSSGWKRLEIRDGKFHLRALD